MPGADVNLLLIAPGKQFDAPVVASPQPTLTGFQLWVRSYMQIPVEALPDDSVWFQYAFDAAMAQVNLMIAAVPGPQYLIAVYNLAGHNLICWTPDLQPPYFYPGTQTPYFAYLRSQYGVNNFQPGIIESSADEGTSQSYMIPDAFKDATMSDLALMQDPYGRAYLAIAQKVGSLWGLTMP